MSFSEHDAPPQDRVRWPRHGDDDANNHSSRVNPGQPRTIN